MTMAELLRLSWTWRGPTPIMEGEGGRYFEIRIDELPGFFIAGSTREEVLAASCDALEAFLRSYLDHGEEPPLPANRSRSWIIQQLRMPSQRALPLARTPGQAMLIPS